MNYSLARCLVRLRGPLCLTVLTLGMSGCSSQVPATPKVLRCGVGPYFPTPGETRKQIEPFYRRLARQLEVLAGGFVTEGRIGLAEALRAGTLDVAWMGPWGYVLARHHDPSLRAIATVKYKDKPTYHALLLARADVPFATLEAAIA